ncbi:MAG TPA: amine dehydrogenase large subunit [Steroidobacteraceae bacterium]|nr:amine dehydrogenase large subunit [Steroidobacteraceae bacterium]
MRTVRTAALAAVLTLTCRAHTAVAGPVVAADPLGVVATLPAVASPHWVWVNDIVFSHMSDGQALLVDGDSGRFLGMLSTGFGFERVVLAKDGKLIFSPETYFSRGTRGTRTDVVTLYDPSRLSPVGEIAIPPKRSANMPMMADSELTDDGAFLLIYNFTPAQSITVVDTRSRRFAGEIETPGCALAYPTGARSFFSICADGALLDVHLDDAGHVSSRVHTRDMFDVSRDPVTEKGVRLGSRWLFVSYGGTVYSIDITSRGLESGPRWSLLSDAERRQNWRPGGLQQLAVHATSARLYAIMHQGGPETHKDPGKEVWVYDLGRHQRVQRIALRSPAGSIQVTRDDRPLLFAAFIGSTTLEVYDAKTGRYLRSVENVGTTPTLLVTP